MAKPRPVTEPEWDDYERNRLVGDATAMWDRMAWACWSLLSLRAGFEDRRRADQQFTHAVHHFKQELEPWKNRRKDPWIYAKFAEAMSTMLGHMMFGVRELSRDQMPPYVSATARQFAKAYREFLDATLAVNTKPKEKHKSGVRGHSKPRQPQPFFWSPVEGSEHSK